MIMQQCKQKTPRQVPPTTRAIGYLIWFNIKRTINCQCIRFFQAQSACSHICVKPSFIHIPSNQTSYDHFMDIL